MTHLLDPGVRRGQRVLGKQPQLISYPRSNFWACLPRMPCSASAGCLLGGSPRGPSPSRQPWKKPSLGPPSGCHFLAGLFASTRNCVFSCRGLTGRQPPTASPGPSVRLCAHQTLSMCLPPSLEVLGVEVLQVLLSSALDITRTSVRRGVPPETMPLSPHPHLCLSSLMLSPHGIFQTDHDEIFLLRPYETPPPSSL